MEELLAQKKKELNDVNSLVSFAKQKHTAILNAINTDEQIKERTAEEVNRLKLDKEAAWSEYEKALAKIDRINNDIKNAVSELDSYKEEIAKTSDVLAKVKSDTQSTVSTINKDIEVYRTIYRNEADLNNAKLAELQKKISDKTKNVDELENNISELTLTRDTLQSNMGQLEQSVKSSNEELTKITESVKSLGKIATGFENQIAGLTERELEKKSNLKALQKEEDELVLMAARIKGEIEKVDGELESKKKELETVSAKALALGGRRDSLMRKEMSLKAKYEQAGLVYPED